MNIHIKTPNKTDPCDPEFLKKIIALINKYDCRKYVYLMTGNDAVMQQLIDLDPTIARCMGAGADPWGIVERAIRFGCKKIQLFKPYYNQEMINKAHAHGIRCNFFFCDDPQEVKPLLDMGIDTILTNDYHRIAEEVKKYRA